MHGLERMAELAGPAVVSGLWQGALLAAAVWLCLRLVKHTTASLRFALWTGVFLVVALLPLAETAPFLHIAPSGHRSMLQIDRRWSMVLAAFWIVGSLLRGCSLAKHGYRLWKLHREAVPLPVSEVLQPLLTGDGRSVQLCTSTRVDRPGVIGFLAPRILIPAWLYPQLTAPEMSQIVLHEVEHLRRRDDWLNLLQKLSLVLFPLNPILIGVERQLCLERELACDDGVLRRTHAPRSYATCLATLAERGLDRLDSRISLALGTLGEQQQRSELGRRVLRILRRETAPSARHARVFTGAVALLLFCGAAGLLRCPQAITFVATSQPLVASVRVDRLPPMRMQTVSYAVAKPAPVKLMEASLSVKRNSSASRTSKHRSVRLRKAATIPQEPYFFLSSWSEEGHARFITLDYDLPVSGRFAALRVEGGWLFVQL